jgi:hypothetical protein
MADEDMTGWKGLVGAVGICELWRLAVVLVIACSFELCISGQ